MALQPKEKSHFLNGCMSGVLVDYTQQPHRESEVGQAICFWFGFVLEIPFFQTAFSSVTHDSVLLGSFA